VQLTLTVLHFTSYRFYENLYIYLGCPIIPLNSAHLRSTQHITLYLLQVQLLWKTKTTIVGSISRKSLQQLYCNNYGTPSSISYYKYFIFISNCNKGLKYALLYNFPNNLHTSDCIYIQGNIWTNLANRHLLV
jgi:hypothetical protein